MLICLATCWKQVITFTEHSMVFLQNANRFKPILGENRQLQFFNNWKFSFEEKKTKQNIVRTNSWVVVFTDQLDVWRKSIAEL